MLCCVCCVCMRWRGRIDQLLSLSHWFYRCIVYRKVMCKKSSWDADYHCLIIECVSQTGHAMHNACLIRASDRAVGYGVQYVMWLAIKKGDNKLCRFVEANHVTKLPQAVQLWLTLDNISSSNIPYRTCCILWHTLHCLGLGGLFWILRKDLELLKKSNSRVVRAVRGLMTSSKKHFVAWLTDNHSTDNFLLRFWSFSRVEPWPKHHRTLFTYASDWA